MEEKNLIKQKPHNITMENRAKLNITGVREVESFDDNNIILDTEAGGMIIKGSSLHINKLNVEDGNLLIEGFIISCTYTEKTEAKRTGSFFSNIFK